MQKAISFEVIAIAQYIYQNNTSAMKERPQEISYFLFLDTQQNKNCSKVLQTNFHSGNTLNDWYYDINADFDRSTQRI